MPQFRLLVLAAVLSLGAGCQPAVEDSASGNADTVPGGEATLPSARQLTGTEIVEVPETGIQLGWGYNMYDATPLPNQCVLFTPVQGVRTS